MSWTSADVRMSPRTAQDNPGPQLPRHATRPMAVQVTDADEEHAVALIRALDEVIRRGHLHLESHPIYQRGHTAGWRYGVVCGACWLIAVAAAVVAASASLGHPVRWL
jgi:hypothetical protein